MKQDIIANIQAHNRVLTKEHLQRCSLINLLRNTHPLDRESFARNLYKKGFISEEVMKQFIKRT